MIISHGVWGQEHVQEEFYSVIPETAFKKAKANEE